ncbi:rod shape-determining protein MreC [Myxococcota bacterium]|nr:rod shape-determining protein MreC [Myxococcota bacterium]MBU1381511.1 rod shape-determining protein MreC [Myxococcota bacterium]MBU1497518.1 rod shape-determining protein MreC [Myxococcota bacterium]
MLLSRRAKEIVLSILLLALPVVFLFANIKHPEKLNNFDRFILKLSAPVQHASFFIYSKARNVWLNYIYLVNLKKENDRLRMENGVLKANNAILEIWAQRGREVEKILGFKESNPSEMIAARVISKSLSPYYRVLRMRLDRGKGKVSVNDPVVTPDGVVGKIHRLYGSYADILLSVDPRVKIPVVVKRTGTEALLVGLGDEKNYTAKLTFLRREEEIKVGDIVVTSGMGGLQGTRFPPDLPVGRVTQIYKKEFGKFQSAIVEATVDFSKLDKVLVVITPPPPQDTNPSTGDKEKSLPRVGLRPY